MLDGSAPVPNGILIVETGTAPRKVSDGLNAEKVKMFRGKNFTERVAKVSIDGGELVTLWPMEDVYFQASTRGGRPIDFLLKGKAKYATTSSGIGSAFSDLGSSLSMTFSYQQSVTYAAGGATSVTLTNARAGADGLEALGAVTSLIGSFINPAADVRYWDNLPDAVHIVPMALAPGAHRLVIHFFSADGREVTELQREVSMTTAAAATGPQVVWVSSRPRDSLYDSQGRR